jgi:hypothetical protein
MMKLANLALIGAVLMGPAAYGGLITFTASLSGPAESPPNASPGVGFATVLFDTVANTMEVQVAFAGLLGTTTASHIHCCTAVAGTGTAGVATQLPTFTGFPLGVTSGTYDHVFDLTLDSTYNPAFESASGGGTASGAETALLAGLGLGEGYLNIHSSVVPGGEIRGFLQVATPEPATFGTVGLALAGLWLLRRKYSARLRA